MPGYYTVKTLVGFHLPVVVNITDYTVVTGQISFIHLLWTYFFFSKYEAKVNSLQKFEQIWRKSAQ